MNKNKVKSPCVIRSLECVALILILIFAGWLIYGVRISAEPPVVREYSIESDKIDEPVTIVMLSDLHGCEHPTLIDQVAAIEPDLILLCGDMINHDHETGEDILVTADVVARLAKLAPVYYSYGNHELERIGKHDPNALDSILEAGAILLEREYVDLEINGNPIRLGGIYTPNGAEVKKPDPSSASSFFKSLIDTEAFTILMEHRPAAVTDVIDHYGWTPDLCLSGHLHGGHVILPLLGPVYGANMGLFPEHVLGRFELGDSTHIVSAGLSTERHIIPRINNPTEITKITLE